MIINRKELFRALTLAARVAPVKSPKPVLQNVMLRASSGTLTVIATDLELYSCTELKVDNKSTWTCLVNAKDARDVVKSLPGDDVELLPVVGTLNMTIGGATLVGDGPDMFPVGPRLTGERKAFVLPAASFQRMIDNVRYAAAREASRYMINGILVELKGDTLRLVATDGRRLAMSERDMTAGDASAVVTVAAMNALRTSMGKKDTLSVEVADVYAQFTWGDTVLVARLLESKFPDYGCVIPKGDLPNVVTVDRKELEASLKRLLTFTGKDLRLVKLGVTCGRLELSAEDADRGKGEAVIESDGITGVGEIAFNPDYLLDGLKASDVDDVTLKFVDDSTPAVFDLGFTYVLMPISGG